MDLWLRCVIIAGFHCILCEENVMVEWGCWLSILLIFYTYLGYPFLLYLWSELRPNPVDKSGPVSESLISVVIAAHNEEGHIGARIENLISQNYPKGKMEIIIVSDGSTDATDAIVARYAGADGLCVCNGEKTMTRLKLVRVDENRGKAHALNVGVAGASGEFIVFTDARQWFDENAIRELTANFNDARVGCVSGELMFCEECDTNIRAEMGFYWDLEKRIRKMEGVTRSVVGATGAIYAIRRSLFAPIDEQVLIDDILIPMNIVFQGYRNVFESGAIAYDVLSRDMNQERRRKTRTLLGNYRILKIKPQLLLPWRNPIALEYVSHKVLRLGVPFFYIVFLATAFMADGFLYKAGFTGGVVVIVLPVLDRVLSYNPFRNEDYSKVWEKLISILFTFVSLNYFALLAFFYFIWPRKIKIW